GGEDDESALLRTRLIRALGELNDEQIIAEAGRRFASFLQDRAALRPSLREVVVHLVGQNADRASYDALLALARKSTNTNGRARATLRSRARRLLSRSRTSCRRR